MIAKTKLREDLIVEKIYFIRGERVMIDKDLSILYDVEVKRLKEAVRRNIKRFPEDFMFELTLNELNSLRTQNATLKKSRGQHIKYLPFVFTEHGIAMLSSVLNSERAIEVNIAIIRAFISMRSFIYSNLELKQKIKELERLTKKKFQENDKNIKLIFDAIRSLIVKESKPKLKIGFQLPEKNK